MNNSFPIFVFFKWMLKRCEGLKSQQKMTEFEYHCLLIFSKLTYGLPTFPCKASAIRTQTDLCSICSTTSVGLSANEIPVIHPVILYPIMWMCEVPTDASWHMCAPNNMEQQILSLEALWNHWYYDWWYVKQKFNSELKSP